MAAFDADGRGTSASTAREDAGARAGGAADAAAGADAADAGDDGDAPASGAEAAPDGWPESSAGGVVPGGEAAAASSAATFLADLARLASASPGAADAAAEGAATAAGVSVTWDVDDGVVPAARAVLDAYASDDDVLVTSGYLDLRGRVWGAVLRGADWVDVATVWGAADDATATVRVTRLLPGGAPA